MKSRPTDSWFVKRLIALGACGEAIKYARKYRTFPAAWRKCDDWGWKFWLIATLDLSPRLPECPCCFPAVRPIYSRRFPADRVAKKLRGVK